MRLSRPRTRATRPPGTSPANTTWRFSTDGTPPPAGGQFSARTPATQARVVGERAARRHVVQPAVGDGLQRLVPPSRRRGGNSAARTCPRGRLSGPVPGTRPVAARAARSCGAVRGSPAVWVRPGRRRGRAEVDLQTEIAKTALEVRRRRWSRQHSSSRADGSAVNEDRPQAGQSPGRVGLHGGDGAAHRVGGGRLAEVLGVAEDEHGPHPRRQRLAPAPGTSRSRSATASVARATHRTSSGSSRRFPCVALQPAPARGVVLTRMRRT